VAVVSGEWRDDALCAESLNDAAFFPEMGVSAKDAQRICAACPVRQQCLEYALDNEIPWGIWGGVTASDRRAMREPVARWRKRNGVLPNVYRRTA
jgi:WhiB family redox-sensing transcriptional regulator